MKTIQILLSLYFLLLAGIPCVDAETAHSNRNEHHEDLCPPFCTCNCCGTFALSQFQVAAFTPFWNTTRFRWAKCRNTNLFSFPLSSGASGNRQR